MGSGDPQTSKGCALGRVFTRQKEEEGHFQDRDVTQDTKTRGAEEEKGQGLRSQPMHLDLTGSGVGIYTRPPPSTKELFRAGRNTVGGGVSWHKTKAHRRLHGPGKGGSHAGSQRLRDQRNQPGAGSVASKSLRRSDPPLFTEHTAPQGENQSLKVDATFEAQSAS